MRAEGERRARALHPPRPEGGLGQLVVATLEAGDLVAEQEVDDLDRLLEAVDELPRFREGDAQHLVLGRIPAGPESQFQPAV
ncbi:MAG TPA: hypothetical protein VNG93_12010 [Candidatus Dormibacteraeota bacterium]|nr:hypothetical protein [Candidatus Dormibacteraeota bacterium]